MSQDPQSRSLLTEWKLGLALRIVVISVLVAVVIVSLGLYLRGQMRQRLVERDAEVLHSVALSELEGRLADSEESETNPAAIMVSKRDVLLRMAELRDVVAGRLFRSSGAQVMTIPVGDVTRDRISEADMATLKGLRAVAEYRPNARVGDIFQKSERLNADTSSTLPLLEVLLPLHRREGQKLLGVIQLIFDRESLRNDFALLDQNLLTHGAIVFLLFAAGLIVVVWGRKAVNLTK